jgi:hypothetical protein
MRVIKKAGGGFEKVGMCMVEAEVAAEWSITALCLIAILLFLLDAAMIITGFLLAKSMVFCS